MSDYAKTTTATVPRMVFDPRTVVGTSGRLKLPVYPTTDTSVSAERPAGAPPVVIPAGQEYYWTAEWQAGERETLAELAAGRGKTFDTAEEALRYLFSADE